MTGKVMLALALSFFAVIAICTFLRELRAKKHSSVWMRRRVLLLWSKRFVVSLVAFEISLLLTSAVPVRLASDNQAFLNYIAFAFPCVAGLVAGGGFFFDGKKRVSRDLNAFAVSAIFVAIGYLVYIASAGVFWPVLGWGCLQGVLALSIALGFLTVTRKYFRGMSDGIFLPISVGLGLVSGLAGTGLLLTA